MRRGRGERRGYDTRDSRPGHGILPRVGKRYDDVADKVGLVPNVRKKDNLYQGLAVLCTLAVSTPIGFVLWGWPMGVMAGALAGLVVGGLVSGLVLMVIGLTRK